MILSVSDVHISEKNQKYFNFIEHLRSNSKQAQTICLLGDIFDLCIGYRKKIKKNYYELWEIFEENLRAGKKIYYFEGNHDFHLDVFFGDFLKKYPQGFFLVKDAQVISFHGKKYFFSHGDSLDTRALPKIYRKMVRSRPIHYLAQRVKDEIIESAAFFLRKNSRENHKLHHYFLLKVEELLKNYDGVILGHFHVENMQQDTQSFYINNGFYPASKKMILIDEKGPRFIAAPQA